jgi:transposase
VRDIYPFWGTPGLARRWPDGLVDECRAGRCPEVCYAPRTLVQWRRPLLAWHTSGYANGRVGGLNSLIKKFKRVAAGFRSFTNSRLRILLACGGCNWARLRVPPR